MITETMQFKVIKRPGLFAFLDILKLHFELVLFTSAMQDYMEHVVSPLEEKRSYFDLKLSRKNITTTPVDPDAKIKDLN